MSPIRDDLARLVGRVSRIAGRGGGTTLPGRALLQVDPGAMERLGGALEAGSALVSATNGKTTTSAMLSRIIEASGDSVVANRAGSNMPWGIVTALLSEDASTGVFEVDEAWLPDVARALQPRVILLGNLFRDQLDRYGETEALASSWSELAQTTPDTTTFVLNADDPLVAAIGDDAPSPPVFFGMNDPSVALDRHPHASDARRCRTCGRRLEFEQVYLGHLGDYHCPGCGSRRPFPDVAARNIELIGSEEVRATIEVGGRKIGLRLPLPGLYNLYNALGAIAAAHALGIVPADAARSLDSLPPVFGRAERVEIKDTEVAIFLIKNPVGANEVLRSLASESGTHDLWLALNDRIADGRDISWIWDADFELLADKVGSVTCSGTRAAELALRLKYAGFSPDRLAIEPDIGVSLDRAVDQAGDTLFALPTYTALLELKEHVSRAEGLNRFWEVNSP